MALLATSVVALLRWEVIPTKEVLPFVRKHKNRKVCIDVNLDEGERLLAYLARSHGSEEAGDFLKAAATEKCIKGLPYGFYRRYMEEELQTTFTLAKREALRRSFRTYAIARLGGGHDACGSTWLSEGCFPSRRQEWVQFSHVPGTV